MQTRRDTSLTYRPLAALAPPRRKPLPYDLIAVREAVAVLVELTDWPVWYARNIVRWRVSRGLPVTATRAID